MNAIADTQAASCGKEGYQLFRFALKNILTKKAQTILVILSITLSAGIAVLAYNVSNQVSEGITNTAGYYSAIVGPAGSATQLAMNTMYFTDEPLGTIPYEIGIELQRDMRVREVIPFAMADSYNGYCVVGTSSLYLSGKNVSDGRIFDDSAAFEVVVGSNVAKTCGLSVGSEIHTSHSVGEEHHQAFTVVGILNTTHTVYDNTVFTELASIWKVHDHEAEEDHEHEADEDHDHGEDGDHDHEGHSHEENMVCSILVKTKNPSFAMTLVNEYDGKIWADDDGDSFSLTAIEPMSTVRAILEDTNTTKYIVYVLCGIILVMNIMVVSIITLLNLHHSAKEIELMRLIGISLKKINLLYLLENTVAGVLSGVLAFILSRICLAAASGFVSDMGIVLNMTKVYPAELLILAGVFLLSVVPTVICTSAMARKSDI